MRNVVAKDTSRDLESTLVEVDTMHLPSHVPCCPLPPNTYVKAGGRAEEVKIDNLAGPAFSYIPDAYGQIINSEAKVTKHVGRRRVEEEEYQIPDSFQSPASLEKSILETKIVRKFALPRN